MTDVKVSIGIEFLSAYSQIAQSEQKRVREFIKKFWENPRSPGINYEKIHDMKDKNVRTVRITDAYRAVDQFAKYLPQKVSEALYFLASGCTVEQTIDEIASKPAAASKNIIPLKRVMDDIDNETALEEADLRERSLLYVAATRAKKEVIITCNGEKSEYLG